MKKILILLLIIVLSTNVSSEESIKDQIEDMDEFYYLILEDNALGGDTLAATDIVLALQKYNDLDIETAIAGEISPNLPKILIGPPCTNPYIEEAFDFTCEEWPYEEGQGLILVHGNDLIISGNTPNDRRRAGLMLKNYPSYDIFEDNDFVIVLGMSFTPSSLNLVEGKKQDEFECGDGVCDIGEKFSCFPDCEKVSCFQKCQEENLSKAFCRDIPANPNVPICLENEENKGMQYCTQDKSCCCELKEETNIEIPKKEYEKEPEKEKTSFFSQDNIAKVVVGLAILLLIIIIIVAYISLRNKK